MLLAWFALGCYRPNDIPPAAPVPFLACAAPVGGYEEIPTEEVTTALTGPVATAGTGDPVDAADTGSTEDCFADAGFGSSADADRDAAWWITATAADGTAWTAAVSIPDDGPGLAVGDEVAIQFDYVPGILNVYGRPTGNLEIRGAGGQLRAWVGVSTDLAGLAAPAELSFAPGPEIAHDADHCGTWSEYDVSVTAAGSTIDLPYGGSVLSGGFTVLHGGYDRATATQCSDWYAERAALAAVAL